MLVQTFPPLKPWSFPVVVASCYTILEEPWFRTRGCLGSTGPTGLDLNRRGLTSLAVFLNFPEVLLLKTHPGRGSNLAFVNGQGE